MTAKRGLIREKAKSRRVICSLIPSGTSSALMSTRDRMSTGGDLPWRRPPSIWQAALEMSLPGEGRSGAADRSIDPLAGGRGEWLDGR